SFSPAPARLAMSGGLAMSAVSWMLSIALVLALVGWSEPLGRFGLVALTAIHGLAAAGFVGIGVLGEYAFRVYEQVKGRPVFLLKESNLDASDGAVVLPADRRPPRAA